MPHICTRCNNVFESGEDILRGCPVCGWKKFMFVRTPPAGGHAPEERIITRAMGVRVPPKAGAAREDKNMAERSVEVQKAAPSVEALPSAALAIRPENKIELSPAAKGEKLESIKITSPGTYELNLPTLFEREELIMAVKEGTYFIDLTSAFRKGKKD
jgi:predicted  nucleic acid-binding Zn-ribbon protein